MTNGENERIRIHQDFEGRKALEYHFGGFLKESDTVWDADLSLVLNCNFLC